MRRAIGAGLLAAALAACGPQAQRYDAAGTVKRVDAPARQITIAHQEIRGFMPAMTMSFDVAAGVRLGGLRAGDRIRFRLERSATHLWVTRISAVGQAAGEAGEIEEEGEEGESDRAPLGTEAAPEIRLTDQDGRPFSLSSLRGSVVLLDFVFTRCTGPCPILTATHVRLQQRLGEPLRDKVRFVSVTVDPENDTPDRLRRYAREQGADLKTWSFLTGKPEDVDRVLRDYHAGRLRDPDGSLNHTVVTYLIDAEGRIRRPYLGLEVPPDRLMADMAEALP